MAETFSCWEAVSPNTAVLQTVARSSWAAQMAPGS